MEDKVYSAAQTASVVLGKMELMLGAPGFNGNGGLYAQFAERYAGKFPDEFGFLRDNKMRPYQSFLEMAVVLAASARGDVPVLMRQGEEVGVVSANLLDRLTFFNPKNHVAPYVPIVRGLSADISINRKKITLPELMTNYGSIKRILTRMGANFCDKMPPWADFFDYVGKDELMQGYFGMPVTWNMVYARNDVPYGQPAELITGLDYRIKKIQGELLNNSKHRQNTSIGKEKLQDGDKRIGCHWIIKPRFGGNPDDFDKSILNWFMNANKVAFAYMKFFKIRTKDGSLKLKVVGNEGVDKELFWGMEKMVESMFVRAGM